ncbi:MAG: ribosome maturation factor RimM [Candidatus Eremiobacterota bacterium]
MCLKEDKELIITIGRIINSFGKNGEVKVKILTDFPERFNILSTIILSMSGEREDSKARILGVRYYKDFVILKLDISSSIEEAQNLKGFFICVKKEELYPLPEGSYYIFDLIGLSVFSQEGELLGTLKDVYTQSAQDLYVVSNGEKEILIPAVKEYVSEINPKAGRIVVNSKGGLF